MWPAYGILMVTLLVCFAIQAVAVQYFEKDVWIHYYLALSPDGLKSGFVWQLLTFQFLHSVHGPWHLLGNLAFIWFFGRPVEERLGTLRKLPGRQG